MAPTEVLCRAGVLTYALVATSRVLISYPQRAGPGIIMTGGEFMEFLASSFDGQLAEDVRLRFDAHLGAGPDCAAYLNSYATTVKLAKGAIRGWDDPLPADVPEDLVKAILRARHKR